MEKNTELLHKFWDSQTFYIRNSADLDRPPVYYFIYVVQECPRSTFTNKISNTPRL